MEEEGKRIYQDNPNFRAFANVLNHPEFETFFKQNFSTWEDCRLSIMILKLFMEIRNSCTPYESIAMVKRALDHSEYRRWIAAGTCEELPEPITFRLAGKPFALESGGACARLPDPDRTDLLEASPNPPLEPDSTTVEDSPAP